MILHSSRHLVRPVGRCRGALIFSLGCLGLLLAGLTPAFATQLTLTWADVSTNEDGFKIERKTGTAGVYGQIATVGARTTGYVDGTVGPGTAYCYRVRAYNSAGNSAYSNEACAVPATATLYTVAVSRSGTGSGTVASSPGGITCGTTCSKTFSSGTSIALSATPAADSTFTGWGGACAGTGGCAIVVNANKSLTATFALKASTAAYTLTLTKYGTGSGTVTSAPTGISCGNDCTQSYAYGTVVTISATPAAGSTFTGWGGVCRGTGTCTMSMTAARSVTATFTRLLQ